VRRETEKRSPVKQDCLFAMPLKRSRPGATL